MSMGTAQPGNLGPVPLGVDTTLIEHGTNQFTIVDGDGSVLTATTTVESSMGSFHMTHGFLLNNQLTDFSAAPTDSTGAPIANRVAAGQASAQLDGADAGLQIAADGSQRGDFFMATGSPGGGTIPQYVLKTLVGVIDWGLDAQQSSGLIDFGASNARRRRSAASIRTSTRRTTATTTRWSPACARSATRCRPGAQSSGVNSIIRVQVDGAPALQGGTDPRREGVVLGDTFVPQ